MEGYGTYRPVPVGLNSFVAAFRNKRILEELKVVPMPWEEKAGVVDLLTELMERMNR